MMYHNVSQVFHGVLLCLTFSESRTDQHCHIGDCRRDRDDAAVIDDNAAGINDNFVEIGDDATGPGGGIVNIAAKVIKG